MKITKVLASFLLLGGVGLAAAVTTSSVAPAQAAAVSAPAVIRLNRAALIMGRSGDQAIGQGYGTLPAGTSWRVTDIFVDPEYGLLYLRVSRTGWIEYEVEDTANAPLLAQLRQAVQLFAKKQGNLGMYVTHDNISYPEIGQTLLAAPVVERPGSTKVVRQLPTGTRWTLVRDASQPAISKGDNSDIYYQVATNQWVKSQYLQIPVINYLQGQNKPIQVYRFTAATLSMTPTRQLKPYTNWKANAVYMKRANGPYYFQVGRNEWITDQDAKLNNHLN